MTTVSKNDPGKGVNYKKNKKKTDVFWTPKRVKFTMICLLTFNVFLFSFVIISSIKHYKTVCVPCYELKWSGNGDLTEFEQRPDADDMSCCNIGSKVLDRLTEKFQHTVSKYEVHKPRLNSSVVDECQDKNNQKPYVMMTGINFTAMANDRDKIIRWNNTKYEGCVNPQNGKIFIKEPGHYLVFSKLKLQIPTAVSCIVHNHEVFMQSYTPSPMKVILEKSQTFCEITSANRETTSTVESEFYFEEHDKLFVRSSHPQHLVSSEYSNMFALHKTRS